MNREDIIRGKALEDAARQALEALEGVLDTYGEPLDKLSIAGGTYEALYCRDAITALRAALAEQEPFKLECANYRSKEERAALAEPVSKVQA